MTEQFGYNIKKYIFYGILGVRQFWQAYIFWKNTREKKIFIAPLSGGGRGELLFLVLSTIRLILRHLTLDVLSNK